MARVTLQGAALIAALVVPSLGGAQQAGGAAGPSAMLERAIQLYKDIQIEKAVALLDTVIMNRGALQPHERTIAFNYAGAANAVLGKKNASIRYYREAIKADADFGPSLGFSAVETATYETARRSLKDGVEDAEYPIGAGSPLFAEVRIGSAMAGVDLYINDTRVGTISAAVFWKVPGNEPFRMSMRSAKCLTPWDTTMMAATNTRETVGRRSPTRCGT
jgi:hypothetical protein